MRIFLIKILLRLLDDRTYKEMNDKVVNTWLMGLSDDHSGYKGYYTIRKKAILALLGVGVEQKEYWINLGRLAELKHLNQLSLNLLKYEQEDKRSEKGG